MWRIGLCLLAIGLHEGGHLLAAWLLAVPCRAFRTQWRGARLTFDFSHTGYGREWLVHAGGGLAGLLTGWMAWQTAGEKAAWFCGLSLVLTAVNWLPIEGLDGGAMLHSFLSRWFLPDTVRRIVRIISIGTWIVLWTGVLYLELHGGVHLGLLLFLLGLLIGGERSGKSAV